jgi:hypothetical protein
MRKSLKIGLPIAGIVVACCVIGVLLIPGQSGINGRSTIGTPKTEPPTLLSVSLSSRMGNSYLIKLTWNGGNGTRYNIYRANQAVFTVANRVIAGAINSPVSDLVTIVNPGTTFYYAVTAIGTNGESVISNIYSITI